MKVEDAKRLVRDAIEQNYLMTCLCKVETREKFWTHPPTLFVGWGEGLGMYDCEESLTNANVTQDFCLLL